MMNSRIKRCEPNCPITIHYEYDQATGRKTRTFTDNNDTRYTYDELGRLKTVAVHKKNGQTVSPPEVTTYTYTEVGSRESVELPNGARSTYEYNTVNRLTNVVNKVTASGQVLSKYRYTLHATGRRIASVEITREEDGSYSTNNLTWQYDAMYRLTNEVSVSGTSTSYATGYSYDLVGNRLTKAEISAGVTNTITCVYNDNDQLTTETQSAQSTGYTYDANGSLTDSAPSSGSATSYSYDLENRLSAATVNRLEGTNTVNIVAGYVYTPFGIRSRADTTTGDQLFGALRCFQWARRAAP